MNVSAPAVKLGNWPATVGLPWEYFQTRGCFMDCRGPLVIAESSSWGFCVRVLTESHDIRAWPVLGRTIQRGVRVDAGAWIGSFALLSGCHIGERAIVAAGSVVRGQNVGPGVIVAGDPARVIARWHGGRWDYLPRAESGFTRYLE